MIGRPPRDRVGPTPPALSWKVTHRSSTSRPTVQLRHDLPDGTHHVDWLVARDGDGTAPLLSFRLPDRLDRLPPGATMTAEAIADHRPLYLDYEGEISGGRGRVARLARGVVTAWAGDGATVRWHARDGSVTEQDLALAGAGEPHLTIKCLTRRCPGMAQ